MAVYKDNNRGTWYTVYQELDSTTGLRRQRCKRGFASKREAQAYEAAHRVVGGTVAVEDRTFEDLCNEYLDSIDASKTARSLRASWLRLHFPLLEAPMGQVTRPALVQWRNELRNTGLANRTLNRGIGYVKAVCAYTAKVYGVSDAGVVLSGFKLSKEDKEEMEVWSPEEFNQFLSCVHGEYYRAYFSYLYWTGARRSEGLALCKDDIKGNRVRIWRSIKHYSNGFLPLKTDSSERTIPLDSTTLAMLQPLLERAKPFVFGGDRSLPISNVQREFARAIKESGVKPIRIHDLRHSHASLLLSRGVSVIAVSKRLGHSSINVTLKTYAHLLKEQEDSLVAVIDQIRAD